MKANFLLLFCLLFSSFISAKQTSNWTNSGYIDASYSTLTRSNIFTSGVFDRVYDLNPDGITLHQGSYTLAYQPKEGFGGLINPILGFDAFIFAPYGWNPFIGMQQVGFDIPQAYLQFAHGPVTLIGGTFMTLAGEEYLDPTKDTNFSRSILYGYAIPTTHMGFRSIYVMNKKLSFYAGVNNGWDNIRDTDRRKTLELSVAYIPDSIFSFNITGYSGGARLQDKTDFGPVSIRNLLDMVVSINVTKKLTLIANYDYGTQDQAALPNNIIGRAIWQGIAGYANYKFNDTWRSSLRGEFFDDRDGYRTGVVQKWKEVTLTIGYSVLKNVELRAEGRFDFSNVNSFIKNNNQDTTNNQQSFALEAVASLS